VNAYALSPTTLARVITFQPAVFPLFYRVTTLALEERSRALPPPPRLPASVVKLALTSPVFLDSLLRASLAPGSHDAGAGAEVVAVVETAACGAECVGVCAGVACPEPLEGRARGWWRCGLWKTEIGFARLGLGPCCWCEWTAWRERRGWYGEKR
jgi:hypothetical protein